MLTPKRLKKKNVLNKYLSSFGLPKQIILDNEQYFKSKVFTEFMKVLGIELHFINIKICLKLKFSVQDSKQM